MLSLYSWDNITQVHTLCNVVLEAPDNIAQENILFNVVLILLGLILLAQHSTGKTLCKLPKRLHAILQRKKCCLNTLAGTTLHR